MGRHKGMTPKRRAQHHHALLFGREGPIAHPCRRAVRISGDLIRKTHRLNPSRVPDFRPAQVHIEVGVRGQRLTQCSECGGSAFCGARNVRVIQKCKQIFAWLKGCVRSPQRLWMPTANKPGMSGSPCLPPSDCRTEWAAPDAS